MLLSKIRPLLARTTQPNARIVVLRAHARLASTGTQPPSRIRRTYYREDGKINRWAVGWTLLGVWCFMGCCNALSFYYNRDDPRMVLANVVAKSLLHLDRTSFASTDFASFEATMAYFKACVLISEWAMNNGGKDFMWVRHRDRLQVDDVRPFMARVDANFAAIMAMPEGQAKTLYHRKVRLACADIHRFLHDFNSMSEHEIEVICNIPQAELTQDQRMAISGIGFGTNTLIRVTYFAAPSW